MNDANPPTVNDTDIAIIGMACRFPGASSPAAFWRNLREGVESVVFFSDEELRAAGVDAATLGNASYVKARPVLEGIEKFDAAFFGLNPREAELMDPQQRLLLECAWQAMEDGGHDPLSFGGRIGIFAGAGMSAYLFHNLYPHRASGNGYDDYQVLISNDKDFLPARISHKLNLKGPSVNVQTACSTALVALHLACQSLLSGDCDMALAGGVTVAVPQTAGYLHRKQMIFSPDGHCRAFDAKARGTLPGSGAGIVLLKPLEDAISDGDFIHAVVKGSSINNDGAHKIGFTAPSVEGQAEVVAEAIAMAGVPAESIGYVEAHGTGTELGDPIEVSALTRAFRHSTGKRGFCALGSVKTNVGHLDTAAGVAGLIKTVMAMKHGEIPASLHFLEPNPKIDFEDSPFFVNGALRPWPETGAPRRAGVSAFGIGGTNAHVVLEEAPRPEPSGPSRDRQLLVLSAKSETALDRAAARLAEHLDRNPQIALADVAFTLQSGRAPWPFRRAVVAENPEDARIALLDPDRYFQGRAGDEPPRPVFMFPGQGAQYPGMGRELYRSEPVFRDAIDQCASLLTPLLGEDLRDALFPEQGNDRDHARRLENTAMAQPALFAVEYALARLLMAWGIRPKAMIGHSIGEYVAACVSGVFSLEDGLKLVAERGRLMAACPPGAMLAVSLPRNELLDRIRPPLSLAAVNGSELCVVSGPEEPVTVLSRALEAEKIGCRRLHTSHAFHSTLSEPVLPQMVALMKGIALKPPGIPYLSNLTGTWIEAEQATDPQYWASHLREPVLFESGLATLFEQKNLVLLEVGPGRGCAGFALRHPKKTAEHQVTTTMRHPSDTGADLAHLLNAVGRIRTLGADVDWRSFYGKERRRRIPLPTYPFERRRYWIDPPSVSIPVPASGTKQATPELHPRPQLKTEFQAPKNPVEERIIAHWCQRLGIDRIGTRDSFFELGGDSLLGTQFLAWAREALGADLTLADLFANPTPASLAKMVEPPSHQQEAEPRPVLSHSENAATAPLSFGQERLWFLERLTPGTATYNMPFLLELEGVADMAMLERGASEIVNRHRALRTAFIEEEGRPVQRAVPETTAVLSVVDLRGLPQPQAATIRLAETHAELPLPLSKPPLFRLDLLRLENDSFVLLACIHHIIADGWSIGVLIRELGEHYRRAFDPGCAKSAELAIQYADYAAWQRNRLQGSVLEELLAFWKNYLHGAPPEPVMVPDRPRPPVQTSPGRRLPFTVGKAVHDRLKRLAVRAQATMFMTLQAGFATLVSRYSGREDLVIGTPVANRNLADTEHLIGFFVNSLALRHDLSGDPDFYALVQRTKRSSVEAFSHGELPFEKLVEALQPQRDLSHSPIFQVMFVFQNAPAGDFRLPGLRVRQRELAKTTARFDLSLFVRETQSGLRAFFEYNTDLFEAATIRRMAGHFQSLLAQVSAHPEQVLSPLHPLGPAERHALLVEWNDTEIRPSRRAFIHMHVEEAGRRMPDALALEELDFQTWGTDGAARLSYGCLLSRARAVALGLRRRGVGPETVVAIAADPVPVTAVAMLAVLMAGGAFLPLDPDVPRSRNDLVLEDSGAHLVLGRLTGETHSGVGDPGFVTLSELEADCGAAGAFAEPAVTPLQTAYLIYTSGTTGRPKGVGVSHRGLVNSTLARFAFYRNPVDRFLLLSPLSFDSAMAGVFWTLCAGATLVLPNRESRADAGRLASAISERHIGQLLAIPTFFALLAGAGGRFPSLKTAIVAGEPCPANLPRPTGTRLYNEYGPTEATVWCTGTSIGQRRDPVPIGRPVANARIYLLDRRLRPVPMAVPGHLHIGGANLARGYHRAPESTALGFVPNPFASRSGTRLYRSGDLAKYLPDGNLQFLGRLDHQIKLRGFRIDPREIESWLDRHAGVADSLVLPRRGKKGPERLAAYVRIAAGTGGNDSGLTSELRGELRKRLPAYMVPADFVLLTEWPRTPNGKVDRTALPEPEPGPRTDTAARPENQVQAVVLAIWQEVLGRPDIPLDADFFELGGHSLLAVQAVSRISRALTLELPLTALFSAPTVAALARDVAALRRDGFGQSPPAMETAARTVRADGYTELPLSFAQQRIWFLAQLEGPSPVYNLPANLSLDGFLDTRSLERTLGEIVRRHESLRTAFADSAGEARQVIRPEWGLRLPLVDLTGLNQASRLRLESELAETEVARVFDLARGPLLRLTLLRLESRRHLALFTMHHIVSDGWSIGVIVREAGMLYEAFRRNTESPLPAPALQYGDYAVWQRAWLNDDNLENLLGYWRRHLEEAPEPVTPPPDRTRTEVRSYRGGTVRFRLPPDSTKALAGMGRGRDVTLFMTLFAAFQTLMRHHTGRDDVVTGTSVANRTLPELDGMIGFFINQLALRTRMNGGQGFEDLLHLVRSDVLGAFAHQDLPFDLLVKALRLERDLVGSPLFLTKFVFQNAPVGTVSLPGLVIRPVDVARATTKFDLLLILEEGPDGLTGTLDYNADLYEKTTAAEFLADYRFLLETVGQRPALSLNHLDGLLRQHRGERKKQREATFEAASVRKLKDLARRRQPV